jgi:hypothetical protein
MTAILDGIRGYHRVYSNDLQHLDGPYVGTIADGQDGTHHGPKKRLLPEVVAFPA